MKENEEIEKIEEYSQKSLELCTNFYVCLSGGGYICVLLCEDV